jgi:membrane-bound serine protease (ClpP class)
LVLFNSPATPDFMRVSVPLVVVSSLITGSLFAVALAFAMRAQRIPVRTGQEALIGRVGIVREEIPAFGSGMVQVAGELWSAELAEGKEPILKGERVEVIRATGIRIRVRRVE